jgi:hypothetical protein
MRLEANRYAGMQFGDLLDLFLRIAGIAFGSNLADDCARAGNHMQRQVDLVLLLVALFGDRNLRLVEAVLLHYPFDAGQTAVEFFVAVEFSQLQAGGARELVRGGIVRNALDGQHAYEIIGNREKLQTDAGGFGAVGFGLNIGETSGGKKGLHGVVQTVAG